MYGTGDELLGLDGPAHHDVRAGSGPVLLPDGPRNSVCGDPEHVTAQPASAVRAGARERDPGLALLERLTGDELLHK